MKIIGLTLQHFLQVGIFFTWLVLTLTGLHFAMLGTIAMWLLSLVLLILAYTDVG